MITLWPQKFTHGFRESVYAPERYYSADIAPTTTLGDRPLWMASLEWRSNDPAVLERIKSELLSVANAEADWYLYKQGKHDVNRPGVEQSWATVVTAFSYSAQTITFNGNAISEPGHYLQVAVFDPDTNTTLNRYVLDIVKVDGRTITVANFPEAISKMTRNNRDRTVLFWNRDDETHPLTIRARILGGVRAVRLRRESANVAVLDPITIIEAA